MKCAAGRWSSASRYLPTGHCATPERDTAPISATLIIAIVTVEWPILRVVDEHIAHLRIDEFDGDDECDGERDLVEAVVDEAVGVAA